MRRQSKDPKDLDFVIVSQIRSGSHMLASALDSHPDIACGGEVNSSNQFGSKYGKVCGCLVKGAVLYRLDGFNGKLIWLTRDVGEIAASLQNSSSKQTERQEMIAMEPQQLNRSRQSPTNVQIQLVINRKKLIADYMQGKEYFKVDYGELVTDFACEEVPEGIARRLTDYLGVEYYPLRTKTYRPEYLKQVNG